MSQIQTLSQQAKKIQDIETSHYRDSLKMLYENTPPNAVKNSMFM